MKLSILIAAYNVESFIEKCVKSCYDKNHENDYEIIVVDDGSTDTTNEVVNTSLLEIPNLKLITKKNEGLGAARNTGVQEAKGKYLWMIDGDDFIDTKYITYLLSELNKKDAYDMYMHNYLVTDMHDENLGKGYDIPPFSGIINGSKFYKDLFAKSFTVQFIFKREIFINNEIAFLERINMQDSEILPRILYFVKTIMYNDCIAYFYVQHPNSFTNTQSGEKRHQYFKSIIEVKKSLEAFAAKMTNENHDLQDGLNKKLQSLHEVIFNHLVFYKYENLWFKKNIVLLKDNGFYPLQFNPAGKLKLVKLGLNHFPILTKKIIDTLRK